MQEQEKPQIKVLNIPELLELILLHLDTRTLLVSAQRKDTEQDQGTINESEFPYQRPIYNPLLVQTCRPFSPWVHEYPLVHEVHEVDENATKTEHERKDKETKTRLLVEWLDMVPSPQKKTAYRRKEASWRKMLLRQPPVHGDVAIFKMHHAMGVDSCMCYKVPPKTPNSNQGKERVDEDDDTTKMDHFVAILTQNPDPYFGHYGLTRVYWSTYVPPYEPDPTARGYSMNQPEDGLYHPEVEEAFAKAIKKSEVIIFSGELIQCCVRPERELASQEGLRESNAEAETKGFIRRSKMSPMVPTSWWFEVLWA